MDLVLGIASLPLRTTVAAAKLPFKAAYFTYVTVPCEVTKVAFKATKTVLEVTKSVAVEVTKKSVDVGTKATTKFCAVSLWAASVWLKIFEDIFQYVDRYLVRQNSHRQKRSLLI